MANIYVVCSLSTDPFNINQMIPTSAFSDYPTALAAAQVLFKNPFLMESNFSAKDLVFMIPLSPAAAPAA